MDALLHVSALVCAVWLYFGRGACTKHIVAAMFVSNVLMSMAYLQGVLKNFLIIYNDKTFLSYFFLKSIEFFAELCYNTFCNSHEKLIGRFL